MKPIKKIKRSINIVFAVSVSLFVFSCSSEVPNNVYINDNPNKYYVPPPSEIVKQNPNYYNQPLVTKEYGGVDALEEFDNDPKKEDLNPLKENNEAGPDLSNETLPDLGKNIDTTIPLKNYSFSPLAQKVYDRVMDDKLTKESSSTIKKIFFPSDNNNLLKVLVDGEEIFTTYKDLIAQAEHEVDMVTFIWESKSDAAKSIGEGIKLAQQNAKDKQKIVVRIIANDFQLDPRKRMIDDLNEWKKNLKLDETKIDVQLATYPHIAFGASHSKYLIVDGKKSVVTGANTELVHNFTPKKWHDTGYLLEGNVSQTILRDFDESWEKRALHYGCKDRFIECQRIKTPDSPNRDYMNNIQFSSGFPIIALPKSSREHLNNDIDNPQDQGWLAAMENANDHINVLTPNINAAGFQSSVIKAVKRGVTVRIITGLGFNDITESLPTQGGSNEQVMNKLVAKVLKEDPTNKDKLKFGWYSKDGVKPIISNGASASHTKFMSIDNKVAIVGSGNMDHQTWNQSREFNILIDSPAATETINNSFFNGDWERAIKVKF